MRYVCTERNGNAPNQYHGFAEEKFQEETFFRNYYANTEGKEKKILLVEDNDTLRPVLIEILRLRGYNVHTAGSGQEALEIANSMNEAIDLLLTDIVLPKISGIQVAEELQRTQPTMKILFMSGYNNEAVLQNPKFQPGSVGYLRKPCLVDDIIEKIRSLFI